MAGPALIIMAAGIGSRYGGLKQIDPVGPNGEIIIDFSIYDALKAGFEKIVFVIKRDIEEEFRANIGNKIDKIADTAYVFQSTDDIPEGFKVPDGRLKPWGTGHAVLSCRNVVNTPFAVINADDFYGRTTFRLLHDCISGSTDTGGIYRFCMAGYILENTLTENGFVARGICSVDPEGNLIDIHERTRIEKSGNIVQYTEDGTNWTVIQGNSTVSMNAWGFTPRIFKELEKGFEIFLHSQKDNLLKAEYFLPDVVGRLISEKKAVVTVLPSSERWYGVTYKEDRPIIKKAINNMIKNGIYPENLWADFKM